MNTTSHTSTQTLNYRSHGLDSKENEPSGARHLRHPVAAKNTAKGFEATMREITRHMPVHERLFSKLIHTRAVSGLSDIIGGTLARPDAVLSGGIFSFALTLAVYVLAKNLGYTLSGFESIGAFMLGWTLGLVYDFLKLMVTGKR